MSVNIVIPETSADQVSSDLRWLTEILVINGFGDSAGGLGGEFGYGVEFENDVFSMFPYYWGDCECGQADAEASWNRSYDHAESCYQKVLRTRGFLDYDSDVPYSTRVQQNKVITDALCKEMGLDPKFGSYVHCTCSHDSDYAAWLAAHPHAPACGIERPNFLHKASGSTVRWYKWIGRDTDPDLKHDWMDIMVQCRASLGY